jgi:DNA-binding XRE family transcriptional regulator
MHRTQIISEVKLAALARKLRIRARRNRAEAARDFKVARQAIIYAEDAPQKSFTKLRCRMIEKYGNCKVKGPLFILEEK